MRPLVLQSILSLALLLAFSSMASAKAPQTKVERFGLFIGSNDGGSERPRLRYAESDARRVSDLLGELGGVDERRRVILLDPDAQSVVEAIEAMNARLAQRKGAARTELVIYYSGHSDSTGLLMKGSHLSYDQLRQLIKKVPADVRVVILDSCASGALLRAKGGARKPPFTIDDTTNVKGQALLTSSSAHEAAQESDELGSSFFTHFLISGLRGAADLSSDGRVSLSEAYRFAFDETLARTQTTLHGPQHAAFDIQLTGTGDLVLTDLRRTSATLNLAKNLRGRVYVRDREGLLVVELLKPAGRAVSLSLEPGRFEVTLTRDARHFQTHIELSEKGTHKLDLSMMAPVESLKTQARGDGVNLPHSESRNGPDVTEEQGAAVEAPLYGLFVGAGRIVGGSPSGQSDVTVSVLGFHLDASWLTFQFNLNLIPNGGFQDEVRTPGTLVERYIGGLNHSTMATAKLDSFRFSGGLKLGMDFWDAIMVADGVETNIDALDSVLLFNTGLAAQITFQTRSPIGLFLNGDVEYVWSDNDLFGTRIASDLALRAFLGIGYFWH